MDNSYLFPSLFTPLGEGNRDVKENCSPYSGHGSLRDHFHWSPVCTHRSAIRRIPPEENALHHLLLFRPFFFLFRNCRGYHKPSGRSTETKLGLAERGNETIRRRLRNIEGAEGSTFCDCDFYNLCCLFHTACYHTGDRSCLSKL